MLSVLKVPMDPIVVGGLAVVFILAPLLAIVFYIPSYLLDVPSHTSSHFL